jgi:hypothetical protein
MDGRPIHAHRSNRAIHSPEREKYPQNPRLLIFVGVNTACGSTTQLQAFDARMRARSAKTLVDALVAAKEAGVDPSAALKLVDWD